MTRLPILVVDELPLACGLLARLLVAYGYDVDIAHDGPSAVRLAEENSYRLAIMEYNLPGTNGVELFRRLRALQGELDGILLSSQTTIDVVYAAIDAGMLHVLPKPADLRELMAMVEEHSNAETQAAVSKAWW
jgi:DNA-binding response OmpR family regulator